MLKLTYLFYFFKKNRALANVQAHLGTAVTAPAEPAKEESMDVDASALPEEVDAKIAATGEK